MKNKLITKTEYEKAQKIVQEYRDQKHLDDSKKMRQGNQELLGSFWIYKNNSYSCPFSDEDYWNVYRKVIALSKDGRLLCEDYEIDSYKKATIKQYIDGLYDKSGFDDGWTQITEKEFMEGSRKVLSLFSFIDLLRAQRILKSAEDDIKKKMSRRK